MNGRTAKLLRGVFVDRPERQRFKKAYLKSTKEQRLEVRKMAKKISEVRKDGQIVQQFKVDEQTHQAIPIGVTDE